MSKWDDFVWRERWDDQADLGDIEVEPKETVVEEKENPVLYDHRGNEIARDTTIGFLRGRR